MSDCNVQHKTKGIFRLIKKWGNLFISVGITSSQPFSSVMAAEKVAESHRCIAVRFDWLFTLFALQF